MKSTTQQASTKLQGGWLLLRSCTCIVLWMDFRSPDCNSLLGVWMAENTAGFPTTYETKDDRKKYNKFYENWTNHHLACLNPTTIDEYRSWTNHCHCRAHSRHVCRQLWYQGFASEKDIGTHQHEADPGEKEYDCLTAKEPKPTGRALLRPLSEWYRMCYISASYHMIRIWFTASSAIPLPSKTRKLKMMSAICRAWMFRRTNWLLLRPSIIKRFSSKSSAFSSPHKN